MRPPPREEGRIINDIGVPSCQMVRETEWACCRLLWFSPLRHYSGTVYCNRITKHWTSLSSVSWSGLHAGFGWHVSVVCCTTARIVSSLMMRFGKVFLIAFCKKIICNTNVDTSRILFNAVTYMILTINADIFRIQTLHKINYFLFLFNWRIFQIQANNFLFLDLERVFTESYVKLQYFISGNITR